jgi:hypothetical protein
LDTQSIIAELEAERERLEQAITALSGRTGIRRLTDGRKRHLSAAARKRISDAMKANWAKRKKAA